MPASRATPAKDGDRLGQDHGDGHAGGLDRILNKVNDRGDGRFSDVVPVVCPNVTIRSRLRELDPELGAASLYRSRDLVPTHQMPLLTQGRVLVANWHGFQPQAPQTASDGGKVVKAGVAVQITETIRIGEKNDTKRGTRWLTRETLHLQLANGLIEVVVGDPDKDTTLKERYLILETKGYDPMKEIKRTAALRWCTAVNNQGGYGRWAYRLATSPEQVRPILDAFGADRA